MPSKRKILILSFVVLAAALALFTVIAYAAKDNTLYYTYTKAIKYCDGSEGCVIQDFIVHCLGDRVIDIEPIAKRLHVPSDFEGDDHFGWCD